MPTTWRRHVRPESEKSQACDRTFVVKTLPLVGRRFSKFFRALSDPTRLQIVCLLAAARDPLCACEIEDRFALSQPTVSHHLKVLREAGIVRVERRGAWAYFDLEREKVESLWGDFRNHLEG